MDKNKQKILNRTIRRGRVRSRVFGTAKKPRLSVFRSLNAIYAQLIDDENGKTLAEASSKEVKSKANKSDKSKETGKALAEKAKTLKIETCVFDRGGYLYHGRVKALADGAREGGLKF